MKIDISSLLSGELNSLPFDFEYSMNDLPPELDGHFDDISFPKPVSVSGEIRNMAGYMKLSLKANLVYEALCARCLTPVSSSLSLDFERTVVQSGTLENTDDPESDDYIVASEGIIDLEMPLAEQILLELPSKLLCKEDCAGLCPKCGKNLNEGDCGCEKKELDPRLAVLKTLLEDNGDNK